eukprot:512501_1
MSNSIHELSLVTVDRQKALQFIQKQVFWKHEAQKEYIFLYELSWFKYSPNNHVYAQNICNFVIERSLQLLVQWLKQTNKNHVNYSKYFDAYNRITQQKQLFIGSKIKEFYKACDLYSSNHINNPIQLPPNKKRKISEISQTSTIHNSLSVMINTIRREKNVHLKNTITTLKNEITSVPVLALEPLSSNEQNENDNSDISRSDKDINENVNNNSLE